MPLKRAEHWATRELHDFLIAREKTPFAWGTNDCALFAADAIQAMTGADIATDFRGYSTEIGAFRKIRSVAKGETITDAMAWCAEKFDMPEWHSPLMAQRGDLVAVEDTGRLVAGIVHLNGRHVVVVGETGLKRLPVTATKRAWKV